MSNGSDTDAAAPDQGSGASSSPRHLGAALAGLLASVLGAGGGSFGVTFSMYPASGDDEELAPAPGGEDGGAGKGDVRDRTEEATTRLNEAAEAFLRSSRAVNLGGEEGRIEGPRPTLPGKFALGQDVLYDARCDRPNRTPATFRLKGTVRAITHYIDREPHYHIRPDQAAQRWLGHDHDVGRDEGELSAS